MKFDRVELNRLTSSALVILARQQREAIERAQQEIDRLGADIENSKINLSDTALLGAGVIGVVAGVTFATGGLAAAAGGGALLLLSMFGVVGGADQINDKVRKGGVLRSTRAELEALLSELLQGAQLIEDVMQTR